MDINRYKAADVKKFKLSGYSTKPDKGRYNKDELKGILETNKEGIRAYQSKLYADGKAGLLIVFQGMDGGGKDSAIANVIGVNPQGVMVHSFKAPSAEELRRDYLWRVARVLPERGMIAVFNRSHYEDVLIVKVHELYKNLNILERCKSGCTVARRYVHIKNFEDYLWENGIITVKIFLHLSKEEQRKRFLKRIDREDKNWKFSDADLKERKFWDKYQDAFEQAIAATATAENPWWIVPADKKPYAHAVISEIILAALKDIDPRYPAVTDQQKDVLARNRDALMAEI